MSPNLKIYFCGSIRGGRDDVDIYRQMVELLGSYGTVLTPFVGDKDVTDEDIGEDDSVTNKWIHDQDMRLMEDCDGGETTEKDIHDRDVRLLEKCDVIVAEVTQTSLGVGYELGRGQAMGKRILCLFRPKSGKLLSAMIRGAEVEGKFTTKNYKVEEIPQIFKKFFAEFVGHKERKNSLDWKTYEPM